MQFFWYDYETGGLNPRRDRPVQFSGQRTDSALQPIGEPVELFCRPALDYLPQPEASLVHGHSPVKLRRRGMSEAEFARRIYAELGRANTCAVGYNAVGFDHVVTQFLFWRNLRDPYAWYGKRNGNSKWDILDLVRAAYALRPQGIEWPEEYGKPSFKLGRLAEANGLAPATHDARADVRATIALARLIHARHRRLFDHYLKLRDKEVAAQAVADTFLWVSGILGTDRRCASLMAPVCLSDNRKEAFAVDLAFDPSALLACTDEELGNAVAKGGKSLHLYRIRTNACPFVVKYPLAEESGERFLASATARRLGFDPDAIRRHHARLGEDAEIAGRIRAAVARREWEAGEQDVDYALYEGFVSGRDRQKLDKMLENDPECSGGAQFKDKRLPELVFRYRARNFLDRLGPAEKARWLDHCRARHLTPDEEGKTAVDRLDEAVERQRAGRSGRALRLLDDLQHRGRRLKGRLGSAQREKSESETLRVGIGHLLTTGRNLEKDRILHVAGIRFFAGDSAPEEKDWVLNPGRKITKRLFAKTGIGTKRCLAEPPWGVSGAEVTGFFAGLDVLFVFDADGQRDWFRDVVLGGEEHAPVIVDLMEMSRFFLPAAGMMLSEEDVLAGLPDRRRARGAPRLANVVRGLQLVLDRILRLLLAGARSPANESRHLLLSLLKQTLDAPDPPEDFAGLFEVAAAAATIRWEEGLGVASLPEPADIDTDDLPAFLVAEVKHLVSDSAPAKRSAKVDESPAKRINLDTFEDAFRAVTGRFKGFNDRPGQREFAAFCARAINEGGFYAAEAGTGIGKTVGYLFPSSEFVRLNPSRQVIVASSTKNLMDQIVEKDWGRGLGETVEYRGIRAAVLKGKSNYLCTTAVMELFKAPEVMGGSASNRLAWLYLFMVWRDAGGRWDGLPAGRLRKRLASLRDFATQVNAAEACIRGACYHRGNCVYPRSQAQAAAAQIVVTNHHKLALVNSKTFTRAWVCIIDEADQFADNARQALTSTVSRSALLRFIRRILGRRDRGSFLRFLERRVDAAVKEAAFKIDYKAIFNSIRRIRFGCERLRDLDEAIVGMVRDLRMREGSLRWGNLRDDQVGALREALEGMAEILGRMAAEWDNLVRSDRYDEAQMQKYGTAERRRIQDEARKLHLFAHATSAMNEDVEAIASGYPSTKFVHILDWASESWTVRRIPFDISKEISDLRGAFGTTILTSATLFIAGTLDFLSGELGWLDGESTLFTEQYTKRITSPFAFEKQVRGVVATDNLPFKWVDFRRKRSLYDDWKVDIGRGIAVMSVAMYGRTLVLFTNSREMRDVFHLVAPVLEDHDIVPLLQSGASLAEIETFRRVEHSVVFGVKRFWTGVDFQGSTLSQVIVVRLPIPNAGQPLIAHRKDLYGAAFWRDFGAPNTSLRFRQGFGRLIRGEKEKGVFVVLDQRLVFSSHMKKYRDALPVGLVEADNVVDIARSGLKFLGLTREFEDRGIDLEEVARRFRRPA